MIGVCARESQDRNYRLYICRCPHELDGSSPRLAIHGPCENDGIHLSPSLDFHHACTPENTPFRRTLCNYNNL